MTGNSFEPNDAANEGADEKQPPEGGRFFEVEDADQRRAYSSDAGPYGVGRTHWDGLGCFAQQQHTQADRNQERDRPAGVPEIVGQVETGRKRDFKQTAEDEIQPGHTKGFKRIPATGVVGGATAQKKIPFRNGFRKGTKRVELNY